MGVYQGANVNVQRGSLTMPSGGGGAQSVDVAISSVNMVKALALVSVPASDGTTFSAPSIELVSPTTLRFARSASLASITVIWQVIEYLG